MLLLARARPDIEILLLPIFCLVLGPSINAKFFYLVGGPPEQFLPSQEALENLARSRFCCSLLVMRLYWPSPHFRCTCLQDSLLHLRRPLRQEDKHLQHFGDLIATSHEQAYQIIRTISPRLILPPSGIVNCGDYDSPCLSQTWQTFFLAGFFEPPAAFTSLPPWPLRRLSRERCGWP